jgi:yecA family protein
LDQEAEALASDEGDDDFSDAGEDEPEDDDNDELEEFDEDDENEPIDFLSEEEEEQLTEFVQSLPGANFSLPKLHGLFSALAAGPETMEPPDLLMVLAGFAQDGKVTGTAEPETILDLLDRFYGGIVESLEFEEFEPQLEEPGMMVTDPGGSLVSWCQGFMLGVDHSKTAWKSWFEDARRTKAISIIMVMSEPETLRQAEETLGEEAVVATTNMISELVPLIRDYWAFEADLDEYLADSEGD